MPYELIGDDLMYDYDLLGADAAPVAPPVATPQQRAMYQRRISAMPGYPGGQTLRTRAPSRAREQMLGFDSVATIAAAATASITSRPQVTFRPDRLVVAGAVAASFLINDLKIGKNSQLLAGVAVPAEAFGQTAFGVRLKMDTAQVSQDIILNVTNISAGALRFNAVMIGPSVE